MNWLLIAIIAHFLFAVVFIIDKYLLSSTKTAPVTYAFYTGLLGIFVLFLIPFDFSLMPRDQIILSFLAGILFNFAILFFYKAIQLGHISRIAPVVGAALPVFTLALAFLFLGERLGINQLTAFLLLVIGGVIMLWPRRAKTNLPPLAKRLTPALIAALLFAMSFVLTKLIFNSQSFINSFIWIRMGGILGAFLFLVWPANWSVIFKRSKIASFKLGGLFVSNKALSAFSTVLINYAIYLGSVTLVNALQGVQYILLLGATIFISREFPQFIKEPTNRGVIIKKGIAILFIAIGLSILTF